MAKDDLLVGWYNAEASGTNFVLGTVVLAGRLDTFCIQIYSLECLPTPARVQRSSFLCLSTRG